MYYTLYFNKKSMEILRLTVRNAVVLGLLAAILYLGYGLYQVPRGRRIISQTGAVIGRDIRDGLLTAGSVLGIRAR